MNWYKKYILGQGLLDLDRPVVDLPPNEKNYSIEENKIEQLNRLQMSLVRQFMQITSRNPMSSNLTEEWIKRFPNALTIWKTLKQIGEGKRRLRTIIKQRQLKKQPNMVAA